VFREAASTELLELALVENIQRADLNPIEEAQAYRRLTDEYGLTQEDAARRVGKSRTAVANTMRLLALEPEIRRSLVAGEVSEGHARALLGMPEGRPRVAAWQEVVRRRLSVRETEAFVRKAAAGDGATTTGRETNDQAVRDPNMRDVEARLRRALSTRVTVAPQGAGARITIDCYSAEEFDSVVARFLSEGP
jgi:ParB family chromosome partitioning protein